MRNIRWCSIVISTLWFSTAFQAQTTDWPIYAGDFSASRFSPLSEITKGNAAQVRRVCTYDTGETAAFQTGPIEVQGVIYFTTYNSTFAIDAATCALKWKTNRSSPPPPVLDRLVFHFKAQVAASMAKVEL